MNVMINDSAAGLGMAAAKQAGNLLRQAIERNGTANLVLATGTSQFETLKHLLTEKVSWDQVSLFHLDEYIGLPRTHPASFRRYLTERFISKVPLKEVHLIDGEANPASECARLAGVLSGRRLDVTLAGIGENGHIAFNDPPADFDAETPFLVVRLDEACRRQQLNEGWFQTLSEVPQRAISMSVKQIMNSHNIICSVPGKRKAAAVKNCLEGPVTPHCPASVLQRHVNCHLYLDREAASLLNRS